MIDFVKGKLAHKDPAYVVIDVNGIGYRVGISLNTFSLLSDDEAVLLYTHLSVKEDSHTLFGFIKKHIKLVWSNIQLEICLLQQKGLFFTKK